MSSLCEQENHKGSSECGSNNLLVIFACMKEDFINLNFVFLPRKITFCHKTTLTLTNDMTNIINLSSKSMQGVSDTGVKHIIR